MKIEKIKTVTIVGLILSLSVAVLLLSQLTLAPSDTYAQEEETEESSSTLPRTLTVVGRGSVNVEPDLAEANIGVQVSNADVQAASDEAEQQMEAILTALQEQGIAEQDIQTSGYNIFVDRPPREPAQAIANEDIVYRVNNNVRVIIRDLDQVGSVLEAAVEAGANNIFGVNFSIDDAGPSRSEARQEAVLAAQSKATELAELAEVELGEIISVSEVIGGGGAVPTLQTEALGVGGQGGGPISPGELEVSTQLEIVYAIQ